MDHHAKQIVIVHPRSSLITISVPWSTQLFYPPSTTKIIERLDEWILLTRSPVYVAVYALVRIHIKNNCTKYEYMKRNFVRWLRFARESVCMGPPLTPAEVSGRRTYLSDRIWID